LISQEPTTKTTAATLRDGRRIELAASLTIPGYAVNPCLSVCLDTAIHKTVCRFKPFTRDKGMNHLFIMNTY